MPQWQFLFSAVFVFQKSCTGNILGIAWDKLPVLLNHVTKTVSEGDLRGAARWPDPTYAQGIPSSSIKSTRSFFNALYFYCFMHYVLFLERLYFLLCVYFGVRHAPLFCIMFTLE